MTMLVDAVADEREALLTFLASQRKALVQAALGLTEEQASSAPSASALSVAGLIKHAASCEQNWITGILLQQPDRAGADKEAWADNFRLTGDETLAGVIRHFEEVAAETERVVRELPDLDVTVPLPDAPWFPAGSKRSARWILLHLIQEEARHAGHADIVRETVDGADSLTLAQRAAAPETAEQAGE
ncbi:DinB family protein [Streptomyces sp. HB2AG]|uniref:DinB family protein n=1 Tax=Streptomyces sp. HB2AG TaxID=2983400 RepID=UPI0022AA7DFB|nr:DinB family protein [Streptomyces sp. HB2AG]MCZ2524331.1 DinB family protein [Streptomyces sp. HB2AG]